MNISAAERKFLKKIASNGGRKRWRGKTKAQKSQCMRNMTRARWKRTNGA